MRVSFKLFVYLSAGFFPYGILEVIASADTYALARNAVSAAFPGSIFGSQQLNVSAGDAAVLAVSRAWEVRLGQLLS